MTIRGAALVGVASVLVISVAGCTSASPSGPATGMSGASALPAAVTSATATAVTGTAMGKPPVRAAGPIATGSTGALVVNPAGVILPDPRRTPGATNPAVTQADIHATICVAGWTATIRPDSSYTTSLKEQQLATGYAYHGDSSTGDYEEDHLISLEIGGSPTSALNLWPQPYNVTDGARTKDVIENKLNELVCDGAITLDAAQHAIAASWWTAYLKYVGTPAVPAPAPTSAVSAGPAVGLPNGATALCNDGTYSYAAHHQGACSHHGGVRVFYT
jgi:hypothetical protein